MVFFPNVFFPFLFILSPGGYYTSLIRPGLRLIALNTNLYYTRNRLAQNFTDSDDPAGQVNWFNDTLAAAVRNKEKVTLRNIYEASNINLTSNLPYKVK